MLPFLQDTGGNPSSAHRLGNAARCAIEDARESVAALIGANPAEIVFTSGGTESNNLAIRGFPTAGVLVASAIEHASVLESVKAAARQGGCRVEWLPVDRLGRVDSSVLEDLDVGTIGLVSIGWANNEIGVIQPIGELSEWCRQRGITLHSDAVQALGKVPVLASYVDLMSMSAHKIGGPQGVGALYVRRGIELRPLLLGGTQERDRRAGTENVAGIVGFAAACRLAESEIREQANRCREARDLLLRRLSVLDGIHVHGDPEGAALPNTLNVRFEGVRGEALVAALDLAGIAVSSGSACAAGAGEASHVLRALGLNDDQARDGIRFSLGADHDPAQIEAVAQTVVALVARMRAGRRTRQTGGPT